jgi:hypothetical protein
VIGEQAGRHYDLTVDEARQLAQALLTAADIAEGHANPVVTC